MAQRRRKADLHMSAQTNPRGRMHWPGCPNGWNANSLHTVGHKDRSGLAQISSRMLHGLVGGESPRADVGDGGKSPLFRFAAPAPAR